MRLHYEMGLELFLVNIRPQVDLEKDFLYHIYPLNGLDRLRSVGVPLFGEEQSENPWPKTKNRNDAVSIPCFNPLPAPCFANRGRVR